MGEDGRRGRKGGEWQGGEGMGEERGAKRMGRKVRRERGGGWVRGGGVHLQHSQHSITGYMSLSHSMTSFNIDHVVCGVGGS